MQNDVCTRVKQSKTVFVCAQEMGIIYNIPSGASPGLLVSMYDQIQYTYTEDTEGGHLLFSEVKP